jgi:hypothetical protein
LPRSPHDPGDRREGTDSCTIGQRALPGVPVQPGVVGLRCPGHHEIVIDDVDASVLALLRSVIPPREAAIRFEAPTPQWASSLKGPCVNLFLHDIVEEVGARGADWTDVRADDGRVVARQPPVRRYRLSYVVSTWASSPEVEHRLLSQVLRTLVEADYLPAEVLVGSLVEEGRCVDVAVADPSPSRLRPHDLWSALGAPPRACFEFVVTAPLRPTPSTETAPPVETVTLDVSKEPRPPTPSLAAPPRGRSADSAKTGPAGRRRAGSAGQDAGSGTSTPGRPITPGRTRWTAFRIRETGTETDSKR